MDAPLPQYGSEEVDTLVAKAIDNQLSSAEAGTLAEVCRQDSRVLDQLAQHTLTQRLLFTALQDSSGKTFAAEIALRLEEPLSAEETSPPLSAKVGNILQFQRTRRLVLKWAAVFVLAGLLSWVFSNDSATARIQRTEALVAAESFQSGQALAPGKLLKFESGLVELRFGCGAELLIEGPAELEVRDAWHGFLKKGRMVAKVGRRARGFTLDGPGGKLVDLGTRFAVSVEDGKGMELHVLEGLVEATPEGKSQPLRLTKNESIRLGSGKSEQISGADSGAFVTAMPPKPWIPPRWVHWDFEETGSHFANRGRGLSGSADLDLHPSKNTPRPALSGPFGQALQFDGDGTYAESPFKGIGGTDPRTVAFWVKVPSDFNLREGYAIVSWGSRIQKGAAWQISINPAAAEGPIGRLRVGVHNAPVVGTTDLRDDQWHHCAVVMYGGSGVDVSTHVLLYIDGKLEPAARKAVMPVQTDTNSPLAHGVWLGRNLGKAGPATPERFQGPSFRGGIDELFIFDSAIGQSEIRRLMEKNSLN